MSILSDKSLNKEKFTLQDQVDYLKEKGCTFRYCTDKEAKDILSNSSYYYKLTVYRKNFVFLNGEYENMDFSQLSDLATIDMYFRYLVLKLTLDLEHALKTSLISAITNNKLEDGYTVIEEFDIFNKGIYLANGGNPKRYRSVDKMIMRNSKDKDGYYMDLFNKRNLNPAIWVLIELMSFGTLVKFVEFYYIHKTFKRSEYDVAQQLLKIVKRLRDSAAHSRPIIYDITSKSMMSKPVLPANDFLVSAGINKLDRNTICTNLKIHDFCCLLVLHSKYVKSDKMRQGRKKELAEFSERCKKNSRYYIKDKMHRNTDLINIYNVISKMIDSYN